MQPRHLVCKNGLFRCIIELWNLSETWIQTPKLDLSKAPNALLSGWSMVCLIQWVHHTVGASYSGLSLFKAALKNRRGRKHQLGIEPGSPGPNLNALPTMPLCHLLPSIAIYCHQNQELQAICSLTTVNQWCSFQKHTRRHTKCIFMRCKTLV